MLYNVLPRRRNVAGPIINVLSIHSLFKQALFKPGVFEVRLSVYEIYPYLPIVSRQLLIINVK